MVRGVFCLLVFLALTHAQALSASSTPTNSQSVWPTSTPTITPSVSRTPTATPSESRTLTPTPSLTPSLSDTPFAMPSASPTLSPSWVPSAAPCSAFPINGLSPNNNVTVYGSTVNQKTYYSSSCDSGNAGVSWYSIHPILNSNVTASTCSSYTNFDTIISIYTGPCDNLQCVAHNDDGCSNSQSFIKWTATEAMYYIGVTGYSTNEGNFQLIVSETQSSDAGCSIAVPVPGPYNPPIVIDGTNAGAIPTALSQCGIAPGDYVSWYRISPIAGAPLNITTCSSVTNFDTVLSVFTGNCASLTCIATNDDACNSGSEIVFTPSQSSYFVAVSGWSQGTGYYQLEISQPPVASSGGSCSEAIVIQPNAHTLTGNTADGSSVHPVCSSESGKANWFTFTTSQSQSLTFSTCTGTNFDTILAIYSGSCSNLACVAYNDDYCGTQSQVQLQTTPSRQYYLLIGGYSGATGTYTITIQGSI